MWQEKENMRKRLEKAMDMKHAWLFEKSLDESFQRHRRLIDIFENIEKFKEEKSRLNNEIMKEDKPCKKKRQILNVQQKVLQNYLIFW